MTPGESDTVSLWPMRRIVLWSVLAAGALIWQERHWMECIRPQPNTFLDFSQEWLSARNYFTGRPVYSPQVEALFVHTETLPKRKQDMLPWNGHPPASILLALPFGNLPHQDAHFAWNMLMLFLFLSALAVACTMRQHFRAFDLLPLLALLAICNPLLSQTSLGQLNGLLVFLTVIAWWADRRDNQWLAGGCIGIAAAVKLFPAFLFLYWLMRGKWKALAAGMAAFLLMNAVAYALFGFEAFQTYFITVVPSVSRYGSSWFNRSLSGFWLRLFNPAEFDQLSSLPYMAPVEPLIRDPGLANAFIWGSQAVATILAAIRCYQARTRSECDRALGLTVIAMLLVSPITWGHGFLMLLVPLAVEGIVPRRGIARAAFFVSLGVLWLPEHWFMIILMRADRFLGSYAHTWPAARPWQSLTALAVQTYALVFLFYLFWRPFQDSPEPSAETDSAVLE